MSEGSDGGLERDSRSSAADPVLVATGLTKTFPGVLALDSVSFSIAPGEIVAVLGQNGAGKSTLIQIFAGAHPAGSYEGTLRLAGEVLAPTSVASSEAAGVALVPQEVNVVPDLSVAENILLHNEPTRWGFIDVAERTRRARKALADFEVDVDPDVAMGTLDLATQQLVVIARALSKNARVLILDEPTAALTAHESQRLFARMQTLKARGVAIIFVSHRLAEVFHISDRIIVMRDGRIRGSHKTIDVTRDSVVAEMIGSDEPGPAHLEAAVGDVALEVNDLGVFGDGNRHHLSGLSLVVRSGEIVGLFGLLGAGCIEAALAIYGAWTGGREGSIRVHGRLEAIRDPGDAVALGLGLVAQDRRSGLIGEQSISDNIGIASLADVENHGFLDVAAARRRARDQVEELSIKAPSIDTEVRTLSGGNQQKVQIARWLTADSRILILIDPTRGVDVGARREIKRIWSELRDNGRAILLASTDAEELVDVCDRVLVLAHGHLVGELKGATLTEAGLLRRATNG